MKKQGTKTNYAFYCEHRGDDVHLLRELAQQALYEYNCKVELKGDKIYITADKPFSPGDYIRETVDYSNTAVDDLKFKLQKIAKRCHDICIPYFKHLAITVKNSLPEADLICTDYAVTLHVPSQKVQNFYYASNEFERCVDVISTLLIQDADAKEKPKINLAKKSDFRTDNRIIGSNRDDAIPSRKEESIMENVELTKELATIIAVMYYRMSPKEQQGLRDNADPEVVKVIRQALKLAAEA